MLAPESQPEPTVLDNPGHGGAAARVLETTDEPVVAGGASTDVAIDLSAAMQNETLTLWSADIRTQKHALGEPYHIYVFLGDFPSESQQWTVNLDCRLRLCICRTERQS